jgi:hypothetical protein
MNLELRIVMKRGHGEKGGGATDMKEQCVIWKN